MRHAVVTAAVVTAAAVALVACRTRSPEPVGAPPDDRRARIERGLLPVVRVEGEDVRYRLEDRMRELQIPAVGIAVFRNYELEWVKTYGMADVEHAVPATDDTTFLAGSISKSVNALAQLQAVEAGTLALDAPINDFLASWKLPDNDLTRATPVTLRMLLSHTAGTTVHGFRGYVANQPVPTTIQTLDGAAPANHPPIRVDLAPGTKFRYSGGGITVSQLALSDRLRQPYAQLMDERVLRPLGMTHSSYDQGAPARTQTAAMGYGRDGKPVEGGRVIAPEMAAAGLWTTAGDLARFFLEVARARAGKSKLISREVAMQMTTKVAPLDEQGRDAIGLGVFLLDLNGTTWFGHGGAHVGFQCDALASLDGGNGVVIMTSSENGGRIFGEIQRAVFAEYGWPGFDPPLVRFAQTPADQQKLVGRYLDPQPIEISLLAGKLVAHRPFGEAVELVPIAADRVVDREVGSELRLRADGGLDVLARHRPPAVATRGADHHLWLLEDGKLDEAVAALRASPSAGEEEIRVNLLGYRLLADDPARAITVLQLNAMAFPDSANTHDSLGEAYMVAGDKAAAIAEYQRALAALEADPRIDAATRPAFREHVEEMLARLAQLPSP